MGLNEGVGLQMGRLEIKWYSKHLNLNVSVIPEADPEHIARVARETFEKYVSILIFLALLFML